MQQKMHVADYLFRGGMAAFRISMKTPGVLLGKRNAAWMHSFNIRIPGEVLVVECQNALDHVHAHRGNQARVVNLHARDAMDHQKLAPFFVNRETVREQAQLNLEKPCESVRFLRRNAVSISIRWTSTGVPKFADILGCITEHPSYRRMASMADTMAR